MTAARLLSVGCALTTSLVALSTSSCVPVYYIPNGHNVPILTGRGASSFSLQQSGIGLELQAAYAPSNHLGLQLNLAAAEPFLLSDGRQRLGEGGVGYIRKLSEDWIMETYVLLAAGAIRNEFFGLQYEDSLFVGPEGKIRANFVRYAVQPSFAYHSRYIDAAVSVRFGALDYVDATGAASPLGRDEVAYLRDLETQVLFEPAFTVRVGRQPWKAMAQLGRSMNLSTPGFDQERVVGSVGIVFSPQLRR